MMSHLIPFDSQARLKEQAFKNVNCPIETELSAELGSHSFTLHDTLIN